MPMYSIAYGHTDEHAAALKRGLEKLPVDFAAKVCPVCDGHGQYRQTYNAGCGMGTYQSMGGCDHCDGTGLVWKSANGWGKAAPESVRNQVLVAATAGEGTSPDPQA